MTERHRLTDNTAEEIARVADQLEAMAKHVRPTDKAGALELMRQATKLRNKARGLEIKAARARRFRTQQNEREIALGKSRNEEREWQRFFDAQ